MSTPTEFLVLELSHIQDAEHQAAKALQKIVEEAREQRASTDARAPAEAAGRMTTPSRPDPSDISVVKRRAEEAREALERAAGETDP